MICNAHQTLLDSHAHEEDIPGTVNLKALGETDTQAT